MVKIFDPEAPLRPMIMGDTMMLTLSSESGFLCVCEEALAVLHESLAEEFRRSVEAGKPLLVYVETGREKDDEWMSGGVAESEESYANGRILSNLDDETKALIEQTRLNLNTLRDAGVSPVLLHQLVDEGRMAKCLRVTKDYRIFLVGEEEREVRFTPLSKAIFLLFLRHPEGIRFKELCDYRTELADIYRAVCKGRWSSKHEQSIEDVVNPFKNTINENCARIRRSFIEQCDEHVAQYYYITGERGETKGVKIERTKVIWD